MGHLAAFEMTSCAPNRRYGNGLRRLGANADATAYFDEHVEADAVHAAVAARDVAGTLVRDDPSLDREVRFGAEALFALEDRAGRWMLDAWGRGDSSLIAPWNHAGAALARRGGAAAWRGVGAVAQAAGSRNGRTDTARPCRGASPRPRRARPGSRSARARGTVRSRRRRCSAIAARSWGRLRVDGVLGLAAFHIQRLGIGAREGGAGDPVPAGVGGHLGRLGGLLAVSPPAWPGRGRTRCRPRPFMADRAAMFGLFGHPPCLPEAAAAETTSALLAQPGETLGQQT